MKKRIISLILVVAMAFLTLTGCAYNYAKDDMSNYTEFDAVAFFNALQSLNIDDGDFGTDEDVRNAKVKDAIAKAILSVTDTADKKYSGTLAAYDSLYFCYYATAEVDGVDHIFFASKMNESSPTNIQLGLSSLDGLNKVISDEILSGETSIDIKDYLYTTSSASVVANGDAISISYNRTWTDEDGELQTEIKWNEYFVVNTSEGATYEYLSDKLVGMKVGEELANQVTVPVTEGGVTTTYQYSNVKVESIAQKSTDDAAKVLVAEGDTVFVSYTYSVNVEKWYNEETKTYDIPAELEIPGTFDATAVAADGTYQVTVSYDLLEYIVADPEGTADDAKSFIAQLIGKEVATSNSITVKKTIDEEEVTISYTGATVKWIVTDVNQPITVTYTPYEALSDTNTTKKTETNVYGEKVQLNGVELTYYVLPVYYLDVEDLTAELILREFASVAASTDDNDDPVFSTVKDTEYKNEEQNKTLKELVNELAALVTAYTTKEKTRTEALTSLNTAQTKYAAGSDSEGELATLKSTLDTAYTTYTNAHLAADAAMAQIVTYGADKEVTGGKIAEILACKKGETGVEAGLVADYEQYNYDTLETAYKEEINTNIATAIINYLNDNVTFTGDLPKRAVKNAYKAIMNTYKYDFYEGNYSSSSSTTTTSTETNYAHYNGDFNAYLIDKVTSNNGDMSDVKDSIWAEAEDTVKDIIIVYVFAEAVADQWDADVTLTKAEKKELKQNLEYTAILYQQYGLSFSYNIDDSYHAEQFDKAMNYLLSASDDNEDTAYVEYSYIKYTAGSQEQ